MDLRNQVKQLLRMCGHALVGTVHDRLNLLERQGNDLSIQHASLAETQEALLQACIRIVETLQQSQQVWLEMTDYEFRRPETGLMAFLYSFLPSRKAIDVGAHVGNVSECLLNSGYEIYAFEPYPPVYDRLVSRLGNREDFHPFNFALGYREAEMTLHLAQDLSPSKRYEEATVFNSLVPHSMPEDLPFTGTLPVAVKTLEGLHRAGIVPEDVSLVIIDTEGSDLEVIRGMGGYRFPVVSAGFWDKEIPFGRADAPYTMEDLVGEMKRLGYHWHIVLFRVWGQDKAGYYCNYPRPVPNTWGNVFFFRDYSVFAQGQAWCSAVLPRTYFKP